MNCSFQDNFSEIECSDQISNISNHDLENKHVILSHSGLLPSGQFELRICSSHYNFLLKENVKLKRRKTCQIPRLISAHPLVCKNSLFGKNVKIFKPNRLLTFDDVQRIHHGYGQILPIGTPACLSCLIKISKQTTVDSVGHEEFESFQSSDLPVHEHNEMQMVTCKPTQEKEVVDGTESQSECTGNLSSQTDYSQSQQSVGSYIYGSYLQSLNLFLQSVNLQAFSDKERKTWETYSLKSRNSYKDRISDIMRMIIDILFPCDVDEILTEMKCQKEKPEHQTPIISEFKDVVDSYRKVETWQQGRQVLSILASRMSYKDVMSLIPEVTPHLYYAALKHSKNIGSALPVPEKKIHRQKMDPEKLDSFLDFITSSNVVRDLPFGEQKLKLSDGTVHNMPNVVRCMGSADIIQQFKAYCQENEIVPLGDSTMYRILSQCGAKVRKSLEGLDYFVAEGGRAFITLQDVLEKLLHFETISLATFKDFQALLLQSKQYLRTDYKIHISKESQVPDHCLLYALSDTEDIVFSTECTHAHRMVCESCEQLKEMIASFEKIFLSSSVSGKENEMNDLHFKTQQATKSIISLKKHIIRCKNQDLAKTQLFENMPTNEVLLICDWAMKFLPCKFREDQSDWFGKRGIPWHICMAFCRKDDGSIGSLGFVHLFANQVSQDSQVTVCIIKDVMKQIREMNITEQLDIKFHLWSDNAGCYKSTEMLANLFHSGFVKTYNFCESQNGKGPCDRTAATIKSCIRRYINQGHDVPSAHAMKEAIDKSTKNVKYRVSVIEGTTKKKGIFKAIPSISFYNNFTFSPNGITAWKAYQVGTGKLISSSTIPIVEECYLQTATTTLPGDEGEMIEFHNLPNRHGTEEAVFTCSNEGCSLSFSSSHQLSSHLMFGKCNFEFHCQSSNGCDITEKMYIEKMSQSFSKKFSVSADGLSEVNDDNQGLDKGWALKEDRKTKRFNENQKAYLTEKFNVGLRTGRKEDPYLVAEEMLTETTSIGQRRFLYEEILTVQQITSFFSRMSRKKNTVDATREITISEIRKDLIDD